MKLVAAAGASDADAERRRRFLEQMERSVSNLRFDAGRWLGEVPGETAALRGQRAQRLLLAVAPQQAVDLAPDPSGVVRGLVLDAVYQLK